MLVKINWAWVTICILTFFLGIAAGASLQKAQDDIEARINSYKASPRDVYQVENVPIESSNEPTITQTEAINGIADLLGKAEVIDFWIKSDNKTTNLHLDILYSKESK